MRQLVIWLSFGLLAALFAADAHADPKWRGARHHGHVHGHVHGRVSVGLGWWPGYRSFSYSVGYPQFRYRGYGPYGYESFSYGYGSPYGTYYNPQANYVEHYLPPLYYPAELAYGPQAMNRFLGLPSTYHLQPLLKPAVPLNVLAAPAPVAAKPRVRVSNLEARRRAKTLTTRGDDLFGELRFHEALQRYKDAARAAPDLAEAYFRQGHALLATQRYEFAATAFKRGLAVDASFVAADFRLNDIYGDARAAKDLHIERLAEATLEKPGDADLLFLIGVFLHFDGEPNRAEKFFRRAEKLSDDGAHLASFLSDEKPEREVIADVGDDI